MNRFRTVWGLFAFAAMFVAFIVLSLLQNRVQAPAATIPPTIESVVAAAVASKYVVPAGTPVVTRVSDAATLAKVNLFYLSVRDGDWLVRYPNMLIAYRHEEGRILAIEQATSTR